MFRGVFSHSSSVPLLRFLPSRSTWLSQLSGRSLRPCRSLRERRSSPSVSSWLALRSAPLPMGRSPTDTAGAPFCCLVCCSSRFAALSALSGLLKLLLIARFVQGAGAGSGMTLAMAMVRDLFVGKGTRPTGRHHRGYKCRADDCACTGGRSPLPQWLERDL